MSTNRLDHQFLTEKDDRIVISAWEQNQHPLNKAHC